MTLTFLPLDKSLEAQKLGVGANEYYWIRKRTGEVCVERGFWASDYQGPGDDILGPAYIAEEIKAVIWGDRSDEIKAVRYGGVGPETWVAVYKYWEGPSPEMSVLRKLKATGLTEVEALYALLKRIKEE